MSIEFDFGYNPGLILDPQMDEARVVFLLLGFSDEIRSVASNVSSVEDVKDTKLLDDAIGEVREGDMDKFSTESFRDFL